MMFSMTKRIFILPMIAVLVGMALESNTIHGQSFVESSEVIRLYEQLFDPGKVPVVTCIDLEKNGKLLALGGDDHSVRLWDVEKKQFTLQLEEHLDWVRGLAFSPDRSRLATVGQDGQIRIWNVQTGKALQTPIQSARGMQKIVFHPKGKYLAVCGFEDAVRIYVVETGKLHSTLPTPGTGNRAIAYSPNGSLLAVAGRTGVIRVWKTSDTKNPIDLQGDRRRVNALAFNSDGSVLASAGDGPFILLWNPKTGKQVDQLPERPGKTFSLTFCDDQTLASGESDNVIRIWNLSTKTQNATLLGHTGTISTMIFEPSTGQLISGSFDTSIRFWTVGRNETVDSVTPIQALIPVPATSLAAPTDSIAAPTADPILESAPALAVPAFPLAF